MTYSLVVTILLIITLTLLINAIRNSLRSEERLERKVRETNSAFNNESAKAMRLADKADSLS
ncbi:hypothetical protein, partial [Enterobacter asburiae]